MRQHIARTVLAILALCAAARADEPKGIDLQPAQPAPTDTPRPGEQDAADDPDQQEEVEKSAAELEDVRKAEEKAGLLPQAPGAGPRDTLPVGLPSADPVAQDLAAGLGTSIDGAPLAEPALHGGGALRLAELAGISEEELRSKYDIPVELNDAVIAYVRFFQTDLRPHFEKWLARSQRWIPPMRTILEKEGAPLDLVYLSMIESGFNAYAYSFAKAAGPWQFMVGTSRRYGLVTDFWVDERRNPYKSTVAAARYLKDLQKRYHGDWYLAWAGYNAGEGKIDRAIRRDRTTDFWNMMGKGRTLRAETRHYVPKLIAAALVSKHPERFGFKVTYEQPWEFEEAWVPEATDLRAVAKAAGVSEQDVRDLNPELRRFCTPPGGWTLRLPRGTRERFLAEYEKLGPAERLSFVEHKLERGEPLAKVARAYGVSEGAILKTNGLRSYRQLKPGRVLVIPMAGAHGLLAGARLEDRRGRRVAQARTVIPASHTAPAPVASAQPRGTLYRVQPGDSLWTIAARFSTTVSKLKRLNGLNGHRARALQVGQQISVRES